MNTYPVPYADLLTRLAMFQKGFPHPVRFQYQDLRGVDQAAADADGAPAFVLVQPLPEDTLDRDTLPLFHFPDLDPIRLWSSFGFIRLITGRLTGNGGAFILTPRALAIEWVSDSEEADAGDTR